jgi:hypothetical protein
MVFQIKQVLVTDIFCKLQKNFTFSIHSMTYTHILDPTAHTVWMTLQSLYTDANNTTMQEKILPL